MANVTSSRDSAFGEDHDPQSDAQAQAALLLVESLMHSLLDNGALTKAQALEAVGSAFEVKEESAGEGKEPATTLHRSLGLLSSIRNSIAAHSGPYDKAPDQARVEPGIRNRTDEHH